MAGNRRPKRRPATTDEGREGQLVSIAVDLAEKQMQDGTASSQVITHFLKMGSTRERLEQERIKNENLLLQVKVESLRSAKKVEDLMAEALDAFRSYAGQEVETHDEDD